MKKLLLVLPLPPPYSGQEKISEIILNSKITDFFDCVHVDSSNKQVSNEERGTLTWINLSKSFRISWLILINLFRHKIKLANIPISSNKYGFIKYMLMVLPCILFKVKIVSRMGGSHFDKFYGSQSQIYKIIIKRILKHVSCIIVRGENQKKQFENIYNGRIEVVYIPSTGILYNNKEFDFSKKEQINILFLAMIAQSKGAFDLLKAIPELVKKDDRLHFHFVGDVVKRETNITFLRSEYFSLKDFISRNQIQSKVTIHGSIKYRNKEIIFKNSDIFVFPSYSEGFPFAVVEAMEYQLPVISTRVGALSEIFRHEKEIYFIPKNSPEKISEAVVELINNPALVKNMIKNCNVVLESILSKKMFEEKMIGIFQNILLNNYQDR